LHKLTEPKCHKTLRLRLRVRN